jgi:hypothetical protein
VQSPANPQTLNRYSYCLNNPLKYVDPSGHTVQIVDGGLLSWMDFCKTDPDLALALGRSSVLIYWGPNGIIPNIQLPLEQDSQQAKAGFNNAPWAAATTGSIALAADDLTGIGIADDALIPFVWAGAAISWGVINRGAIADTITNWWDSLTTFFSGNVTQGKGKAPPTSKNGNVRSRTHYDKNGNRDYREDYDHNHGSIDGPHRHDYLVDPKTGNNIDKDVVPLP